MIEPRIVRRYVAALFAAAKRAGVVDRIESDLGLISYAVEMTPQLMEAISSPLIDAEKKHAILAEIFEGNVHEITLNYLYTVVDKRREEVLFSTEEEYLRLANEDRGVLGVQVITAVKMTDDEQTRLKEKLQALTGKKIALTRVAIPEILGGMLIRIGDKVIDGSIKGQMQKMVEHLLSGDQIEIE